MIYLYAIIDRPGVVLPSLTGLENAPLSKIVYQDIGGIFTSFAPDKELAAATPDEENLWKHEAVLEALMPDHSVLPLRFGSILAGESALLPLMHEKYASFSANLQRVQGCVELSLHVKLQSATNQSPVISNAAVTRCRAPVMSGKDYIQILLKVRQQEQDLHQQIETQIGEHLHNLDLLATEKNHTISLTPYPTLKAAYLLAQQKVILFRQEVENLAEFHPNLHFTLTGPWPPYSFVAN